MKREINVEETREICNDSSRWHSVVSAYHSEKGTKVYACMYII